MFTGGSLVGRVALASIVRGAFLNAYLGYAIDRRTPAAASAPRAVRQAVAIAWAYGLHRVQAAVSPDNLASQRVLEKVGFRREGLAERYLRLAGHWTDQELWAITTEDELGPTSPERSVKVPGELGSTGWRNIAPQVWPTIRGATGIPAASVPAAWQRPPRIERHPPPDLATVRSPWWPGWIGPSSCAVR